MNFSLLSLNKLFSTLGPKNFLLMYTIASEAVFQNVTAFADDTINVMLEVRMNRCTSLCSPKIAESFSIIKHLSNNKSKLSTICLRNSTQ